MAKLGGASPEPSLAHKMRKLADTGHPQAALLRERADAFEDAARAFYLGTDHEVPINGDDPITAALIFTWQQARVVWQDAIAAEPGVPLTHQKP